MNPDKKFEALDLALEYAKKSLWRLGECCEKLGDPGLAHEANTIGNVMSERQQTIRALRGMARTTRRRDASAPRSPRSEFRAPR